MMEKQIEVLITKLLSGELDAAEQAELDKYLEKYPQYKDLTADDIRDLAKKARKLGYVVSKGLFHEEVTSLGVPVFDKHEQLIAAITVSAINERMGSERRAQIASLVKEISSQHN